MKHLNQRVNIEQLTRSFKHQLNSIRFVCSLVLDSRHITTKEYWCPKRASSIQYGYRKWGTHARVFSQTPTHGNGKIEIRQWNRGSKKRRINVERSTADTKKEALSSHFVESSRPSLTTVNLDSSSSSSSGLIRSLGAVVALVTPGNF